MGAPERDADQVRGAGAQALGQQGGGRGARVLSCDAHAQDRGPDVEDQRRVEAQRLTVDAGGVSLDGWMLKPSHFDPARTYPLITFVYGEPAGATATDAWHGDEALFHRALAEAGYVVVSMDNRGTPAPKGAPPPNPPPRPPPTR